MESVAPSLAGFTLPAIARATGVSTSAAAKWRAGRRIPQSSTLGGAGGADRSRAARITERSEALKTRGFSSITMTEGMSVARYSGSQLRCTLAQSPPCRAYPEVPRNIGRMSGPSIERWTESPLSLDNGDSVVSSASLAAAPAFVEVESRVGDKR